MIGPAPRPPRCSSPGFLRLEIYSGKKPVAGCPFSVSVAAAAPPAAAAQAAPAQVPGAVEPAAAPVPDLSKIWEKARTGRTSGPVLHPRAKTVTPLLSAHTH